MERLDPAIQDLGKPRDLADGGHGQALGGESRGGAAGRYQFDTPESSNRARSTRPVLSVTERSARLMVMSGVSERHGSGVHGVEEIVVVLRTS